MGRKRKLYSEEKTTLGSVYRILEKSSGTSKENFERQIFTFLNKVCDLKELNPNLTHPSTSVVQRNFLKIILLKVILNIEDLRSLCLFPPKDCALDRWVCFASPCRSSDLFRCHNPKVIELIRSKIGHTDNLPPNYYDQFEQTWGLRTRFKLSNKSLQNLVQHNSSSPMILFPIRLLPGKVEEVLCRQVSNISGFTDELFLCCDHFSAASRSRLFFSLRSDQIFNYSLEYLSEIIQAGLCEIKSGKKGWGILNNLPTLISKCRNEPSFATPKTVSLENIAASAEVKNLTSVMGTPSLISELASLGPGTSTPLLDCSIRTPNSFYQFAR